MSRILLASALLGLATVASADGPGSRIRITPPQAPRTSPAAERDLQRCEALRADERERCLKDLRAATAADERTRRGPESIGGTAGAGSSGATSGTTGGGTFGGTAPR